MSNKSYLLLITAVTSMGGLLFGYDTGVINGTQYYFSQYFDLSAELKGFVVGSALIGCFTGALLAGPMSIAIGRKNSLIISAILFSISAWGSGKYGIRFLLPLIMQADGQQYSRLLRSERVNVSLE